MDENLRRIFSTNLRKYLELSHRTQADMARYMKISSATASDWVNGNKMPRSDKLQSLANWFHIELSDLLTEQPEDKRYYPDDVAEIAQEIYDNKELRMLFDAARDVNPEALKKVADMVRAFKGLDHNAE